MITHFSFLLLLQKKRNKEKEAGKANPTRFFANCAGHFPAKKPGVVRTFSGEALAPLAQAFISMIKFIAVIWHDERPWWKVPLLRLRVAACASAEASATRGRQSKAGDLGVKKNRQKSHIPIYAK